MAVGLVTVPAQADSKPYSQHTSTTGTLGRNAAPGGQVTREQVIARAEHWVKKAVPYSQSHGWKDEATGGHYRQDCSGFVSMAWQLKGSLTTWSLPGVADRLAGFSQLEAGDALNYSVAHALLFGGWTDRTKGDFVYYSESRSGRPALKESANIYASRIAGHPRTAYVPLRYKKLVSSPAPAEPVATPPARPAAPAARPSAPAPAPAPGKRAVPPRAVPTTPPPTSVPLPKSPARGAGTSFAATADRLYAISPDRSAVYEYTGEGDRWVKVRGRTGGIYTSARTLYATDVRGGDIHAYDRARGKWTRIGGPGAEFAATDGRLYGISPDRSAVYEYTGKAADWIKVGGPAAHLYTSGNTLYATDPRSGDIHQYHRARTAWTRVGGPGADFAATRDRLYGASPDHSGVYAYTGTPGHWFRIGGPLAP
ncbi:YncE family protein [Streptomyces anulatus]|uniref:hypothetical protein n=1 Tax=Streptomyces anulatus TaxID=1892 RepID=UPI00365AC823